MEILADPAFANSRLVDSSFHKRQADSVALVQELQRRNGLRRDKVKLRWSTFRRIVPGIEDNGACF